MSSKWTYWKCESSRDSSDEYKVDQQNKRPKAVKALKIVNIHVTGAVYYKGYRPMKRSPWDKGHISEEIAKWSKRMILQIRSAVFKTSDLISILSISHNSRTECDSIGINEELTKWLFQHVMNSTIEAALAHSGRVTDDDKPYKDGKITHYYQLVYFLLATYTADDINGDAEAKITNFKQQEFILPKDNQNSHEWRLFVVVVLMKRQSWRSPYRRNLSF